MTSRSQDDRRDGARPHTDALVATATVVGLQVLLPRVFSVLLWYHLGFLAVSLAMLGFALGGLVVRRRAGATGVPGGNLDTGALLAAASVAVGVALLLVVRLPIEASQLLDNPVDGLLLLLLAAALAVPFALLGTTVCAALDTGRERLGGVYGATFFGGAAGALLCLASMELLGPRRTVAVLALIPLLGAAARPRWRVVPGALLAIALLIAPSALLPLTNRKHFPRIEPHQVLGEASGATSHVIFYDNVHQHGLGPPPEGARAPIPDSIAAAIDAWAITFFVKRDGPDDFPAYLQDHQAGLAWVGCEPGFEALVIGAGGGWDVLGALDAGAAHVTAVEINADIVDAAMGRWAAETADLYRDPRVEIVVAEGRHYVETHERQWDRLTLAGVDTFAATQAGAFALAESYLYTVEAFESYLRQLKPGGRLFMTRWWFRPPRQTLRLMLTAVEALRRAGVEDPRRRLFVARGGDAYAGNSLFVLKAGEDFTIAEIRELEQACTRRGATPVYAWGQPSDSILVEALDSADPRTWIEEYPYRVDPTTDDRPFFFENGRLATLFRSSGNWIHDRLGGQEVLAATFVILLLLSLPLLASRSRGAPGGLATLPFLGLGFGYLLVEVPLMQRLSFVLGHPVYAVAVVLVALLVWSGLGALAAMRLPARAAAPAAIVTAVVVSLALLVGGPALEAAVRPLPLLLRAGAVALLLAPLGFAMGTCFPLAVRVLDVHRPLLVPSAFLWNGVASVLAGPVAVIIAMDRGFAGTLLTGAGCYAVAGLTLWALPSGRTRT